MEQTRFIEVILPLPLPDLFTYRVPREMTDKIAPGQRVVVPFGKRKVYAGLVREVHSRAPEKYTARYIDAILDDTPLVDEQQFHFWEWMARYYMCCLGEVMNAALPASLKLASETRVVPVRNVPEDTSPLTDKEYLVHEALSLQEVLTLKEMEEVTGQKNVMPLIRSMIDKGYVMVEEEVRERYVPKTETFLRLAPEYSGEEAMKQLFDDLKRAPKQLEVLMAFLKEVRQQKGRKEVRKVPLQKAVAADSSVVKAMVEKGIFQVRDKEVGRLSKGMEGTGQPHDLNEPQQKAYETIRDNFREREVVLLHGVTSSGKTEIYVHLIRECLKRGEQVLYLVPEIALTTQLIDRIRYFFGDKVGIYHSRFNPQERAEVWQRVNASGKDRYDVVLGPRSAVFLPFRDLGLIIVDEEHESTFKQYDPAPRYQGRDAAVMLGVLQKAKVLLGTATLSVESYYNARSGKYGLVNLSERYGGIQMPEILCADIRKEMKQRTMKSIFSSLLMEHLQAALNNGKQVILFQNRRGHSPVHRCLSCGWVPECDRCDISLTYHKNKNQLVCHYCGYSRQPPVRCDHCGSTDVRMYGFGTEQVEEELGIFFPKARVRRMDLDTTRTRNAYQNIIREFEAGAIDVLVGTQMVTKGLDFDNVDLVGVMSADSMLNFPDLRSNERAFQLMAQVAGRAGRKGDRGKVVIQSFDPYNHVIRNVIANDHDTMFRQELTERRQFHYPPYYRLIRMTLRHRDRSLVDRAGDRLGNALKKAFGEERVLGPEYPMVARIRNQYNKNLLLKIEKKGDPQRAKELLKKVSEEVFTDQKLKPVRLIFDVDPF